MIAIHNDQNFGHKKSLFMHLLCSWQSMPNHSIGSFVFNHVPEILRKAAVDDFSHFFQKQLSREYIRNDQADLSHGVRSRNGPRHSPASVGRSPTGRRDLPFVDNRKPCHYRYLHHNHDHNGSTAELLRSYTSQRP